MTWVNCSIHVLTFHGDQLSIIYSCYQRRMIEMIFIVDPIHNIKSSPPDLVHIIFSVVFNNVIYELSFTKTVFNIPGCQYNYITTYLLIIG